MVRRVPSKHKNARVTREYDRDALTRLGLLLGCGLLLAGGFVYAGGRHFAALRLGYQTQKLRAELETAREEQRRLTLEREAAASPVRLERAARQLGMQPMLASQVDPLKAAIETAKKKVAAEAQTALKLSPKAKPDKAKPDQKKRQ
jgi:cell division protein FtsL